jgi:uncharacterized paraquat-inducible protein A
MPIKFNCPKCGKKLSVPDSFAGRKARCPGCNEAVGVPASSQEEEIPKYDKAQVIGDKAPFSEAIAPLLAKLDLVIEWGPLGITGAVVLALGLILLILRGDEREKTAAMIVVGLMMVALLLILYFEMKASRF